MIDIFRRPTIVHYILVRMTILSIVILGLSFFILRYLLHREESLQFDMVFMVISLLLLMLVQYIGAKKIQKKMDTINATLTNINLESFEELKNSEFFIIREFDNYYDNLSNLLVSAHKRERDKDKYYKKLKLKNKQRSDMLSAIAHEFRNPISAIMGYAQTINEDPNISPTIQAKFLKRIYNNGQKIEDILKRLILWNKFESGEATLTKQHFEIMPLVNEAVNTLEEKYKNRKILIYGENRTIYADKTLIEIVLINLLENGLKYSKKDVIIRIQKDAIFVVDSGVGISPDDFENVTKKFFRSSEHHWNNSMGLGLSIVKTILTLHETHLEIQSKEGEGSQFSFKL